MTDDGERQLLDFVRRLAEAVERIERTLDEPARRARARYAMENLLGIRKGDANYDPATSQAPGAGEEAA